MDTSTMTYAEYTAANRTRPWSQRLQATTDDLARWYAAALQDPRFHHVGFRQFGEGPAYAIVYLSDPSSPTGVLAADAPHLHVAEAEPIIAQVRAGAYTIAGPSFRTGAR